jgi:hypothetical protein
VTADNNAKRVNGGDKTAEEFLGSKNFVNAHPFGRLRKLVPVYARIYSIAVMQQMPWCTIPGESFEKLSRGPFLSGTGSDGEVKRTSAIMVENKEDEEELEGHRWDEQEVYQVPRRSWHRHLPPRRVSTFEKCSPAYATAGFGSRQ